MRLKLFSVLPLAWMLCSAAATAAESRPGLTPCRLEGVEHEVWCGKLQRPLDPAQPKGTQIDIHYAVLPALARNRKPDPVLFFAGGPGQSALDLAGAVGRLMARVSNRRDIVLIDQRGTGRSAPLRCPDPSPTEPLATAADPAVQTRRLRECGAALQKLPYGDLRQYTTWIATQDADAVRQALGVAQVNLIGGSYGTRAALDYLRQFPQAVRRTVIDGVAPPDMVLPASFSVDNQAALDAAFAACRAEPECRKRHPDLAADWQKLLAGLPREVSVLHPITGAAERVRVTREMVLAMVRAPLYVPAMAAALPVAIERAAAGRFEALLGLSTALGSNRSGRMSEGMHFSVVCAEDLPRLGQPGERPGADYGDSFASQYREICDGWPRGTVPPEFYRVGASRSAVLVLSGGADPVTPPRHGERMVQALGGKARHVVVPNAGHGVMALPCMRDVLFRFIDAETDDEAAKVEADCARSVPRPGAFVPVGAAP